MSGTTDTRYAGWLWLIPAALGLALTLFIMVVLPPDRTLHSLGDVALKVGPLLLAVLAIAVFPQRHALSLAMLAAGIVFYMGFIDSTSALQVAHLVEAASAGGAHAQFAAYYRFSIFVDAFVVLFALLAYRLGGGSTVHTLKLGLAGILILISGLNDVTMWAMYPWPAGTRPTVFDWASHVSVFIGHAPRLEDMLIFLAIHLALAATVLCLPLQRWLDRTSLRRPQGRLLSQDARRERIGV